MANKRYDKSEGVWRTIGGRRVFIKTGQSLSDAMKDSGKFKKVSDVKREEYQYKKDKLERERQAENSRKYIGKEKRTEEGQEAFNKYAELHDRTYVRENPQEADTTYDLVGKHINKEQQLRDIGNKNKNLGYSQKQNILSEKYEYDLYKRAQENPDSIDPMTENSTDWEALDRKYSGRYKEEYIKVKRYPDDPNNHEYTSVKRNLDEKLDWREQIKKNNEQMEKDLDNYKKTHNMAYQEDGYYEIFRENERRNAKIKQEVPTEPYEYVGAYAGYRDKSYKLAGTKMNGKDIVEYGTKSWTGKEYTNDEFMEHLEDSNWHSERKQLLEAKLTNEELSYIKDHTTLSQWSVGEELTGSKNTQKMIDEAKDYSKFAKKIREKQNTPYYKQQMDKAVSDLQSSNLKNKYKGTYQYLQETTNMSGNEILELLKKIEQDKK